MESKIRKTGQCLRRDVRPGECFRPTVTVGVVTTKDRCVIPLVDGKCPLVGEPPLTPEGGRWWWDSMGVPFRPNETVDLVPLWSDPEYKTDIPAAMPAPQLVDGLTRAQCLERYTAWQRGERIDGVANRTREGGNRPLTAGQLRVAREEWSAALKAKVTATDAEAKRKDREQVVCDDDRWEE